MNIIQGRKVFEDETYLILWTNFFGLRIPLLGSVYIQMKETGVAAKATFFEKRYVLALIGEVARLKPNDVRENLELVFERFAGAVFARGFVSWKVFFSQMTPAEQALEIAEPHLLG